MSTGLQLYLDVIVFFLGAAIGSFANVCIYRMPREMSIVTPRSRCGTCERPIAWYDNIPLISYLVLKGACRWCGSRFSFRYWLVEFLMGVLWLGVWLHYRQSGEYVMILAYWVFIALLVIGSFIDFEFYIIPDEITLGGVVVGFFFSIVAPALQGVSAIPRAALHSFLGIIVGGGVLYLMVELGKLMFGRLKVPLSADQKVVIADGKLKEGEEEMAWEDIFSRESDRIRFRAIKLSFQDKIFENVDVAVSETTLSLTGADYVLTEIGPVEFSTELLIIPREAMGLGDAKLLAAVGAFLGWQAALVTVFCASVVGGLVSLALISTGKKEWQSRIPYGPYLALGALLWIYYGRELVDCYMQLIKG
jgi:leader peptidase (prepilin peptidase) / N-methyltransferase